MGTRIKSKVEVKSHFALVAFTSTNPFEKVLAEHWYDALVRTVTDHRIALA